MKDIEEEKMKENVVKIEIKKKMQEIIKEIQKNKVKKSIQI